MDPYSGGVYGDPYDGILISDGRLVVKAYGGSNWRWGFTNIYEYEKGEMEEKWVLDLSENVFYPGYDFTITDKENGTCRSYAVAGEWEREGGERGRIRYEETEEKPRRPGVRIEIHSSLGLEDRVNH